MSIIAIFNNLFSNVIAMLFTAHLMQVQLFNFALFITLTRTYKRISNIILSTSCYDGVF